MTVLLRSERFLSTLDDQNVTGVELVTWNDEEWHTAAARIAESHRWLHRRVASALAALTAARSEYVIEWDVYEGSVDALASLVDAAAADPTKRGSLTANWDPAILWRRDEYKHSTGRAGLAQATGIAYSTGSADPIAPR